MKLSYPKICQEKLGKIYITVYQNSKRYRLYSSKRAGKDTYPNRFFGYERTEKAKIMAAEVYNFLLNGGVLNKEKKAKRHMSDADYLLLTIKQKREQGLSEKYLKTLEFISQKIQEKTEGKKINQKAIFTFLQGYANPTSFNTLKRHVKALLRGAEEAGMQRVCLNKIKNKKSKAKLHRTYADVGYVLEDIRKYNYNLYLCCLITYGCLLRPHREIRNLVWNNFSKDLKQITIEGKKNKSGKNRTVPVSSYIQKELNPKKSNQNVFSKSQKPYNEDYFKNLWRKYKKQTNIIQPGQTIYSFRHTGAIEIFKRTGSITKLQKAMGHSSINVSLTYLRGLEVTELKEEDMPMI